MCPKPAIEFHRSCDRRQQEEGSADTPERSPSERWLLRSPYRRQIRVGPERSDQEILQSSAGTPGRGNMRSCIESEDDLVRFLVAPMSEPAPLAHDQETALRQHANRRGVVARSASVKRTGCFQLQELL